MRNRNGATLILVAAAACGCIDIGLLDDMVPLDAGDEGAADGDGDGDGDVDGDADGDGDGDGPPATDATDTEPPAVLALACSPGERTVDLVCVAEGPVSASLRLATDEPATVTVGPPEPSLPSEVLSGPWAVEHHAVVAGLPAGGATVELSIEDVNGNATTRAVELAPVPGPAVAVTEVYADPAGPEPAQEFVEIANLGDEAIDVSGWMVDDEGDANGDPLPDGTLLGPRQVALLVAPDFDPLCADDPAPAPGALIVYLPSSIGSSGLKNTEAESVELYDGTGALVSRYAGEAGKPAAGVSAERIRADIPEGNPWAWRKSAPGGSTPGSVPTVD